ncbi:esterase family protein [Mucilaginibacter psychrotolerans]|nr:alpha/beta hydrolase-fold protein [Mucilaginibacter psychrotolerans]
MNREYHKWYSPRLQRNMELLIFGHAGRAVLFFPTRMARFYDYENWGIVDALQQKINGGEIQLFCVDSIDAESFYNRWAHPSTRMARHLQYEEYLLNEVLPLMSQKNSSGYFETAGCSMGAYHALNIGLKYPHIFKKIVSMSGRYDLTRQIDNFNDLFDGFHNPEVYFNMPGQYVANLHEEQLLTALRRLTIILAIGQTDPFLYNNREISQQLWDKGISNEFYVWDNYAHRPRYWKKMVQLYL